MAKKKWPRMPSMEVPLFGGRVYLALNTSEFEQALSYLDLSSEERAPSDSAQGATLVASHKDGETIYLVGVFDGLVRTLVHELAHVTFFVLDGAGVETGEGDRETFCYLQDNLFTRFAPHLKEAA